MLKLIALDLDGTLLKTDKSVSEHTKNILCKYRQKGIKIIYATGRGGSAEDHIQKDQFDGRVLMNGAVAYAGNDLVYERLISITLAREFLLSCDKYGLQIAAELSGTHYSNFNVTDKWSNIYNYKITDFSTHTMDAEKIYAIINNEQDIEFIKEHIPTGLYLTVSRDMLAQVMHIEATKSMAIHALAEFWDIEMSEIVSFGDDLNDIDMLSECGIGVAMGNALEEVKAASDDVCDTNDNDGIANWLTKYFHLF